MAECVNIVYYSSSKLSLEKKQGDPVTLKIKPKIRKKTERKGKRERDPTSSPDPDMQKPPKKKGRVFNKLQVDDFPTKPFHEAWYKGTRIRFFEYKETVWTPAKEICDAMGVSKNSSSITLTRAGIEGADTVIQGKVNMGHFEFEGKGKEEITLDVNILSEKGVKCLAGFRRVRDLWVWYSDVIEKEKKRKREKGEEDKETQ
jgi:hypothetical protein